MFKFNPYERYMMPAHFGGLHQGDNTSGWYRDVTMMVVPFLTDREKLAAYLPSPFTVAEQPIVTVAYAHSKDVDWLAGRGYNLVAVTASAVFNGENEQLEGQYSLVWWENLADAILSGRELTGIPKIFADIEDHDITDGHWRTSVSHFDNRILDMSVKNLRQPSPEEIQATRAAQEGKDHPMAWRYFPGVGGFGATVSEPTTFPSESVYTGAWIGEGSLDWNHLTFEQNPTQYHIVNALADLPVLAYLPAMVTKGSTNLFVPDRMPRVLDKKETLPANQPKETEIKTIEEIETVCFIGAGTMGCSNALVAAVSGYQVELFDISVETLQQVPKRFKEFASFLVGAGYCTATAVKAAFDRISVGADLAKATANADLVSESAYEDLEVKREVHRQLDEVCPEATILTTNTSGLLVSEIEDVVQRDSGLAAMHFYLGSRLVDIVAGPRTGAETIDILCRYVESLDLVPMILKKEHPGYVMNALLASVLMRACALVVEGVATVEEVDRTYMRRLKSPMGPFGIMDMIGLGLVSGQTRETKDGSELPDLQTKIAAFLKSMVERGDLGMQSGKGFYTYPVPAYQAAEFLNYADDDSAIQEALVSPLIRSGVLIALKGVADPEDIDRTWMVATNQEAGPFGLLLSMGVEKFIEVSRDTQTRYGLLTAEENELIENYVKQL
jgi:3-hydroxybutyryl-CoA dehydrogenase